jgi:hypothetical protein
MILLVSGGREWTDKNIVEKEILSLGIENIELLINGGAKGLDLIAANVALKHEIPFLTIPAKWSRHHKAAGPIRNNVMLNFMNIKPTYLLAFHDNIGQSKGTKDMVERAKKINLPYKLVSHGSEN